LIVTRLQTQRRTKNTSDAELYTSFLDAIEKIYASEGISGLYSGWAQDTIASVSSTFFYHFAYQYLREKRLRRANLKGEKTLGIIEELLVGALAGVFSRFFTTPLSNLVTRKQTAGQNAPNGKVASSASILRDIYNEKGITGTLTFLSLLISRILVRISFIHPPYSQSLYLILSL
jgi:Mitochondrial carrier protein